MLQSWKIPPIIKGTLTWLPILNSWRLRHTSTGGSNSPRYCYSVWLRHLVTLDLCGFKINGAQIGELGPGDSIGIGLAALLSGATRYVGLDIVPFSAKVDQEGIFDELVQMFSRKEPIPDHNEFPLIRPTLNSYEFPNHLIDWTDFADKAKKISSEVKIGVNSGKFVSYQAPWTSPDNIAAASLDLVFSQAVLEHVDTLEETYQAMFTWLKPGGYASHIIDFYAHGLSPLWNGHWAYSDWEWRLVRGRRECLLNREPLSTHLVCAKRVGFQVLLLRRKYDTSGLNVDALSQRFQALDLEDVRTRGALLILCKR
jgi:SAM-dependent methyltransferase